MKNSIITNVGLARILAASIAGEVLNVDKMIFYDIPNLNTDVTPEENIVIAEEYITYQTTISNPAKMDQNTVVYSHVLDANVGSFFMNCIALFESSTNTLVAVCYVPRHKKIASDGFVVGNTLYKNFAIHFQNIATISNITIDAESWQFNFGDKYALKDHTHNYAPIHDHPYAPASHVGDGTHATAGEKAYWTGKSDVHDHPYAPASHVGDGTHATAGEKAYWSGKSDVHDHPYAPASHVGDGTHATAEEKVRWNNKADTILSNVHSAFDFVIERGHGYIKWRSGKIMQWGVSTNAHVNLPIPLPDLNYTLLITPHRPTGEWIDCIGTVNITDKATTYFGTRHVAVGNGNIAAAFVNFDWLVINF